MRPYAVRASAALLAFIVPALVTVSQAEAQSRVQLPSPYSSAPPLVPVNPGGVGGAYGTVQPPGFQPPGAVLGGNIQPFDPYALPGNLTRPSGGLGFPQIGPNPGFPGAPAPGNYWPAQPPSALSVGPIPDLAQDGAAIAPSLPPVGAPYGQPTTPLSGAHPDPFFQGSPYAAAPQNPYGVDGGYGQAANEAVSGPPYQRLFQDTGLRGTYIFGRDKDDLGMTEAEASTTAYLANFLGIPNGLRVSPGFAFHWTDGPAAPETSDVPGRLYSAYLDFGLEPTFTPRFGAELTARVGLYSDFQSFNADSIRLLGTVVGTYQLNDRLGWKFGAAYIDRVKYKLFPAIGVLWTPNPQTRWDIFFPAPKLSNYWTTVGNQQVWWYVGAEYGGGSWSIEREEQPQQGANERLDINDIRIYAGVEWWNLNRLYGFAEIGYVFDRELVYFRVPGDSINVDDSFMVRAGVSW